MFKPAFQFPNPLCEAGKYLKIPHELRPITPGARLVTGDTLYMFDARSEPGVGISLQRIFAVTWPLFFCWHFLHIGSITP